MATTAMLRVRTEIHEMLRDMADAENASMQEVLLKALDSYRRQRFLEDTNRAFAELEGDEANRRSMQEEQAILEGGLLDGLPPESEFAGWR